MKAIWTSLLAVAVAMTASDASAQKAAEPGHWITTWTASPMNTQPLDSFWLGFYDQTVREVARLSVGGDRLRLRLSNEFGSVPVVIDSETFARECRVIWLSPPGAARGGIGAVLGG